jgi:hypothetical protein
VKFTCNCGAVISDQTDYLPYKAHILSDQDAFDAADISESGSPAWLVTLTRHLYECNACGRLWLEDANQALLAYVPEGHRGRAITPALGDLWKAPLRASWNDKPVVPGAPRGVLYCARGTQEIVATFDDWLRLEATYHEVLESRRGEGTLRDAALSCNGELVHSWPDRSASE